MPCHRLLRAETESEVEGREDEQLHVVSDVGKLSNSKIEAEDAEIRQMADNKDHDSSPTSQHLFLGMHKMTG